MQKFLIIQTAFIGDVVLATALAEKINLHYPEATIDFLLRKGNEGLLINHPFINKIWIWDKKNGKKRNLFKLSLQIRRELYTHVINPHRFTSSGLISAISGAPFRSGFQRNPLSKFYSHSVKYTSSTPYSSDIIHEVERNHELIAPITDHTTAKPRLYPSPSDEEEIQRFKKEPYICIAPASVWFTKQFPPHKWVELIREIPIQYQVYLLGGKGHEQDLCAAIQARAQRNNCENLSGQLSYLQSVALMRDAVMNYVNDSAPLHFCSAVNAPVTAVFCSTVPAFGFGPLSDQQKIVEINEPLSCRPCGLHGRKSCPQNHFHCAEKIEIAQLL